MNANNIITAAIHNNYYNNNMILHLLALRIQTEIFSTSLSWLGDLYQTAVVVTHACMHDNDCADSLNNTKLY